MARPLRIDLADGWYHVTARGNERRAIFRDDRDREHFLKLIETAVEQFGIVVHGFVLMDNHYHLVVETPRANLSAAMQWVNVSYSVWFNRRRGRAGHLFAGRFKAVVAEPGAYAVELSRYVHLNPVRVKRLGLDKATQERTQAGLGGEAPAVDVVQERVRRLREYRWSSYRAYVGLEREPEWLTTGRVLEMLGAGTEQERREMYREFVESAAREGTKASLWERLEAGLVLGGREFVERMKGLVKGDAKEQPGLRQLQRRVGMAEVVEYVAGLKGARWEEFRDEYGDWGRDLALYLGRRLCGLKMRELAEWAGGVDEATVSAAIKRLELRSKTDQQLRERIESAKRRIVECRDVTPPAGQAHH